RRHTRSKRDWSSDVCSSDLCLSRGACSLAFSSPSTLVGNQLSLPATHSVWISVEEAIFRYSRARSWFWLRAAIPQSEPPSITGWVPSSYWLGIGKVPRSSSVRSGLAFLIFSMYTGVWMIAAASPLAKTTSIGGLSVSRLWEAGEDTAFWNFFQSFSPWIPSGVEKPASHVLPDSVAIWPPASQRNCSPEYHICPGR